MAASLAQGVRRAGMFKRAAFVLTVVVATLMAGTSAAFAFWSTTGTGSGFGSAGTLNAPSAVTAPASSAGLVSVSWTASATSASAPAPAGYYVTRTKADNTTAGACGTSASSLTTTTSCSDSVGVSGTYRYSVTAVYHSWSAASASSGPVVVTIAVAAKLAFTTQPASTTAAAGMTVAVAVQDSTGNAVQVSGRAVTLAIGTNPAAGTLSGTKTVSTDTAGVATFSGLSIDKAGAGYTLVATSSGLSSATSASFTISPGSASALAFTTQPTNSVSGAAFANSPVVKFQDANGNNVGAGTGSVTLALQSAGGATLTCASNPVAATSGAATFNGCSVDKAGTYTLTASSGSLASAQSVSFKITAGSPAKLAFMTQPGNGTGGTALGVQPAVGVLDASGNLTTATTSVSLALTTPNGATLACAANPVNAASGVATFSSCAIDKVGSYTLTASASGLTAAISGSVTISTGQAAGLCFVTATSTVCLSGTQTVGNGGTFTGRVQLVDAGNNPVVAAKQVDVNVNTSGDLGTPSPSSVSIAAGSTVSTATFSTKLANGSSKSGGLTGHPTSIIATDATLNIHA